MQVWIVNHYADPPDGMATRSFDIARRLVEKGHSATIFLSNFNHYRLGPARPEAPFGAWWEEEVEGVRLVWLRTTPYRRNDWLRVVNMTSFTLLALAAGLLRRPGPDVVIGVSVHPLAALAGCWIARLRGARFICEVTDLWPQTLIDFGMIRAGGLAARFLRALERYLFKKAERVVMLWRHTEDYVESLGVSSRKVIWIPHGVELDRYLDLEPYQGAPEPPFRIMYLGGFVESMALETILEAAQILSERNRGEVRFLLVGSGTHREQVMAEARRLELTNVEFPPAVPKKDIARAMSQADAFIYGLRDLPLYRFGMSLNKLSDYLAGARPIIFYGRSSYDPVTDSGAGFTVPPGDPAAVADAVERLLALRPEDRIDMGRRGRAYLLEHHNIPVLADRLLAALDRPVDARIGAP